MRAFTSNTSLSTKPSRMKKPLLLYLLLAASLGRGVAAPSSTAIAYQGRLTDAGAPAKKSDRFN